MMGSPARLPIALNISDADNAHAFALDFCLGILLVVGFETVILYESSTIAAV
jgi:hypothetical protein